MKFEIRDPASTNPNEQPILKAVREELPARVTRFVPLVDGMDGTPHRNDDGSVFMGMCGSYETVLEPCWMWTVEVPTIEDLMEMFSGYEIAISESKSPAVAGLIEFEEPPSHSSSYS